MARTKADATRKAGGKAPRKSNGGRPAPYPVTTRSASKPKKTTLNPVVQRPTPEWQKPITNFFPSDERKNEAGPSTKDISEASTSRGVENTDPNSDIQAVEEEADSEDSDVSMETSTLMNEEEVAGSDQNPENSNKTDVFNVSKEDSSVESCYEDIHDNDANSSEKSSNEASGDFQGIKCEADSDTRDEVSDISLETSTSTVANEDDVADNYPLPMAPDGINDFQVVKCDADSDKIDEGSDISFDTSTSTLVNEDVANNYPLPDASNEIIDLIDSSEGDERSVKGCKEGIDEGVRNPDAKNSVDLVEIASSLISDAKKQTKESAIAIKKAYSSFKGEGENLVDDGEYIENNTEGEVEFIVAKPDASTDDGIICLDKLVKPPSAASPISTGIKDD